MRVLKGDLKVHGSCRIEGAVDGNVSVNEDLYIGLNSYVKGQVSYPKLLILKGTYAGIVSAKKMILKETCKITKGQMEIEELDHKKGCVIEAEIKLKDKEDSRNFGKKNSPSDKKQANFKKDSIVNHSSKK